MITGPIIAPLELPPAEPYEAPIFAVDARALKVFRILFYIPSLSATPAKSHGRPFCTRWAQ